MLHNSLRKFSILSLAVSLSGASLLHRTRIQASWDGDLKKRWISFVELLIGGKSDAVWGRGSK